MKAPPYDEDAVPVNDEDKVLATTLRIPGYPLYHEPNELCWCDPIRFYETDDDGVVDFTYEHRTAH